VTLLLPLGTGARRVVVGFSGGVTSAWCAGWALRTFPREEVVLLFHDTKEEHPDTYRFIREMAAALGHEVTERSDGRSVTQLFRDEGYLGNNQNAMCSRVLKAEQGERYLEDIRRTDPNLEVVKVIGYGAHERKRVDRMVGYCAARGVRARFPVIEEGVTKQQCAEWCACEMGVKPSAMYEWSEHANCIGCVKGARAYWLAVAREHPEVFEQRAAMEEEFGHVINRGGNAISLRELVKLGSVRASASRERIEVGACDCGD